MEYQNIVCVEAAVEVG